MEKAKKMNKYTIYYKNNKRDIICFLILSLLLILVTLRSLEKFSTITIVGDEFGYWSTAAKLAGYDWTALASRTPYYSYGYGILITPLFWLFRNPRIIYRAAILLNAGMLWGIFGLSYIVVRKIKTNVSNSIAMLIAWAASCFPGLMLYTYCAWSEIPICFFTMVSIVLLLKICEKPSVFGSVSFSVITVFLYQIHQRNLGIVLAAILVFGMMYFRRKINGKQTVAFFAAFLIRANSSLS